jgi:hypothetical protein
VLSLAIHVITALTYKGVKLIVSHVKQNIRIYWDQRSYNWLIRRINLRFQGGDYEVMGHLGICAIALMMGAISTSESRSVSTRLHCASCQNRVIFDS